jgi:rRNA 2'-O-methyltransferase fibrillarin
MSAHHFLRSGGHAISWVKVSFIDSTVAPEAAFRWEVANLQQEEFRPLEHLTL